MSPGAAVQPPPRGSQLLKDVLVYGAGSFGARVIGLLLLPFYTAVLSREEFGYLDLVLTGSTLFVAVASLKLFDAAYRCLWETQDVEERRRIVSTALNMAIVCFLVVCGLALLLARISGVELIHAGLIFVWLALRLPTEFLQQTARATGRKHVYPISGLVLAGAILVLNVSLLGFLGLGVEGYLWAMLVSYGIALAYCVKAGAGAQYYRPGLLSPGLARSLLKYSLPLLPTVVGWWLVLGAGRYVLSHTHGLDAAGIYAVADKLPAALYLAGTTFYLAWQDLVLKHFDDPARDVFLERAMRAYIRAGLSAAIVITVLLEPFFLFMIDPAYREAQAYVPWLLLAVCFMSLGGLYEPFFLGTRRTLGVLWSVLAAATVGVVLNLVLTPALGIWATTLAAVLAGATHLAVRVVQCRKRIRISWHWREIALLLSVFAGAVASNELQGWSHVGVALLVCVGVALVNRADLAVLASLAQRRLRPA